MNWVPLNSLNDGVVLVNMDQVLCIKQSRYWPSAAPDGVECSHITSISPGVGPLEVKESRVEIMKLLQNNETK